MGTRTRSTSRGHRRRQENTFERPQAPNPKRRGPSVSWSGAGSPDAAAGFTLWLDAVGDRAAQRLRAPLPPVAAGDVRRQFPRALAGDHARGAQHGAARSACDSGEGAALVRLAGPVFRDPAVERQVDAGALCSRVRGPAVLAGGRAGEDRDAENRERLHGPTMQRPDPVSQLGSRFKSCSFPTDHRTNKARSANLTLSFSTGPTQAAVCITVGSEARPRRSHASTATTCASAMATAAAAT